MNRVLITGGAGFIGSSLARHLIAEGYSLRILDTLSPQVHGALPEGLAWLKDKRVEFMRGSVNDRRVVEAALKGVECLVHLAAETGTGQSMYEVARYNFVNSQGTAVLLDVLANVSHHDIKRFVLTSSRAVYGEGAYVCNVCSDINERVYPGSRTIEQLRSHQWDPLCPRCCNSLAVAAICETDPVRPASIYAATKYAQEDLVRVACESLDISYTILRLQNVYGEGQSLNNPYTGILSIFSTRVRQGLELAAFEDGKESRDFVHVDDVARVIGLCIAAANTDNQLLNVGSGSATSVLEVAARLADALGREPNIRITAQYRVGDIRHSYADISRLRALFGYQPQVTLYEGLRRFASWVLTQPLREDQLEGANEELRARGLMS